jgi:hypothetical protein
MQRSLKSNCHSQKFAMTRILVFVFLIFSIMFSSCDPCANLKCISENISGQFRIVSKQDGKDLLFGPTRIYDKAKIKFYTLKGGDTLFFQYDLIKFPGNGYDSIIYIRFYPVTITPVYLKLNDTDIDTLDITYHMSKSRCCGTFTEITKFRYNNLIDIPGNKGIQEIKK